MSGTTFKSKLCLGHENSPNSKLLWYQSRGSEYQALEPIAPSRNPDLAQHALVSRASVMTCITCYISYRSEQIITSGTDGKVTVWDSLDDDEPLQTFKLHSNDVHPLAIRVSFKYCHVERVVYLEGLIKTVLW